MKCFLIDSAEIRSSTFVMLMVPSYKSIRNCMRKWTSAGWSLLGVDSNLMEAMRVGPSYYIMCCMAKLCSLANSRCFVSTSTGLQVKKKGWPNSSMMWRSRMTRLETRSEKIIEAHS